MPFISIRTKLLTGVLGVILLLGGLLIIFINTTVPKKLEIEFQKRAVLLAEDIAYESIDNLLTENVFNMQLNLIRRQEVERIEYIFILDSEDRVFASTFVNIFPADLKRINIVTTGQKYSVQHLTTKKDGSLM